MKELTVLFPYLVEDGEIYILMGKQAPGKKLAGYLNGYGGKSEPGEGPDECVVREVKEEIGLVLDKASLLKIGRVKQGDQLLHIYFYPLTGRISIPDSSEFVGNEWYRLLDSPRFTKEMLPGDEGLFDTINAMSEEIRTRKITKELNLDLSDNRELLEVTKQIFR